MNAAAIEKLFADAAALQAKDHQWPNNTVSTIDIPVPEPDNTDADDEDDLDDGEEYVGNKKIVPVSAKNIQGNTLPLHGNQGTMNLNNMVHANVIQSPYYRHHLNDVKTYQEVVEEIFYHVKHLEPWERGSRRTEGQVGMCGSVRGVGAGGIVSSAFCLLYKLHGLKLTKKQLLGLLNFVSKNHVGYNLFLLGVVFGWKLLYKTCILVNIISKQHKVDKTGGIGNSPYVRGIGFMYIRYTQQPATLWEWYEVFMDDNESIDPKAGGGDMMTIGGMIRNMLTKLDWYGTLFPRIPVPVQKQIDCRLEEWRRNGRGARRGRTVASPAGATSRTHYRERSKEERSTEKRRDRDDDKDDEARGPHVGRKRRNDYDKRSNLNGAKRFASPPGRKRSVSRGRSRSPAERPRDRSRESRNGNSSAVVSGLEKTEKVAGGRSRHHHDDRSSSDRTGIHREERSIKSERYRDKHARNDKDRKNDEKSRADDRSKHRHRRRSSSSSSRRGNDEVKSRSRRKD